MARCFPRALKFKVRLEGCRPGFWRERSARGLNPTAQKTRARPASKRPRRWRRTKLGYSSFFIRSNTCT
jgi:hypothetical protein